MSQVKNFWGNYQKKLSLKLLLPDRKGTTPTSPPPAPIVINDSSVDEPTEAVSSQMQSAALLGLEERPPTTVSLL